MKCEAPIWHKADHLHDIRPEIIFFFSVYVLYDFVCLGCSRYLVPSDSQSFGDNGIVSTHHPLRRAPCSLLERAHISRSWSATTLHRLSFRSVCLHLWWGGTDSLHYGPHARIRCGEKSKSKPGFMFSLWMWMFLAGTIFTAGVRIITSVCFSPRGPAAKPLYIEYDV